jgi:hypothetical protein
VLHEKLQWIAELAERTIESTRNKTLGESKFGSNNGQIGKKLTSG